MLDRVRARLLQASRPWSSRLASDRERRVLVMGLAITLVSFSLASLAPLWLLALGPIVLGVPHLLADLRYCGLRTGLLRKRNTLTACGIPLVLMCFWGGLAVGFIAVGAAFACSSRGRGTPAKRVAGVSASLCLACVALQFPVRSAIAMAHIHNFVALALWWAWRPRPAHHLWIPAAVFAGWALIMLGAADGLLPTRTSFVAGLNFEDHAAYLTTQGMRSLGAGATRTLVDGAHAVWASRWVVAFAFAQAVHYGIWLHLVRDDDRRRRTPRTFKRSYIVLRREFGGIGLSIVGALCLGLALWATVDLVRARSEYFRFAQFHGALELCAGAALLLGGRPSPSAGRSCA